MAAYEVLLLNTAVPQIQAAQSGDTYVVPRDIAFTTNLTLTGGTADGVAFLNGSKVLTTGSALTFDGTVQTIGSANSQNSLFKQVIGSGGANEGLIVVTGASGKGWLGFNNGNNANIPGQVTYDHSTGALGLFANGGPVVFSASGAETMRLTSTGLGIGTSSPAAKLDVSGGMRALSSAPSYPASGTGLEIYYASSTFAGTPSAYFISYDRTNGAYKPFNFEGSNYIFRTSGTASLVLDSSGNLGLGVTPSAWTSFSALQIGETGCIASNAFSTANTQTFFGNNVYYDGAYKYIATGSAVAQYILIGSEHRWYNAPSGTANSTTIVSGNEYTIVTAGGNFTAFGAANNNVGTVFTATSSGTATGGAATQTIVFSQAMTLDASGNLGIGTSSPSVKLQSNVSRTSGTNVTAFVLSDNVTGTQTSGFGTQIQGWSNGGSAISAIGFEAYGGTNNDTGLGFYTQSAAGGLTRQMTISSVGNVGIGTSSPQRTLHVENSSGNLVRLNNSSTANGSFSSIELTSTGGNNCQIRGVQDSSTAGHLEFYTVNVGAVAERARITSGGDFQTSSGNSVMIGGTAARATTAGTNRLDIFDGTAPVGTLANGVSFYSTAGEARVMDAAGNATLLSPHDTETNEWIFHSKHTPTGKVLRIDVERLLKFVNDHFGLDAVQEFIEE